MARGEYAHNIDSKGRLFIPSKFREELGSSFIITKGVNQCLAVYSEREWDLFERKINELPTKTARPLQLYFIAASQDLEIDAQGRVLIPQKLREFAGLKKQVVVAGMLDHVEVWDADKWDEATNSGQSILDVMEEAGI